MFAYMHRVFAIAVIQHALGNSGRGMFFVGQHAYLPYPFY